MSNNRKIIDIHNHPNWYGYSVDKLIANMDEHGIDKTWLLSWEIDAKEFDYEDTHREIFDPRGVAAPLWMVVEGLQKYPDRLIGGWAPDPRNKYVRARLKSAVKLHGIKVFGELKCRMRYDDPDAIAVFRYCGELNLPVLFHLDCAPVVLRRWSNDTNDWPRWYGGDISVVENMCRLCPDTKFIGHAPGFWIEISADADVEQNIYPAGPIQVTGRVVQLLRKYDNLYCDLASGSGLGALKRDPDYARTFLKEFQDRIMFGRDQFDSQHYDFLESLELSEDILEKIFRTNAVRIIED